MKSTTFLFLVFSLVINFPSINCGFPCSTQYSMKPANGGKPQNMEENPPPFRFMVLNLKGEQVKLYKDDIYTIKLTSDETFFRSFLIQARLSTRQGFVIGHLRSGEFLPEPIWDDQGIQIQKCAPIFNDSLTAVNDEKKYEIQAKWKPHGNDGPIQFVLTVVQEPDSYWYQWSPESGLLLPDKSAKFTEQKLISKQLIDDKNKVDSETKFIAASSSNSSSDLVVNSLEKEAQSNIVEPVTEKRPSPSTDSSSTLTDSITITPLVNSYSVKSTRKLRTKTPKPTTTNPTIATTKHFPTEIDENNASVEPVDNRDQSKSDILPPFVETVVKPSRVSISKNAEKNQRPVAAGNDVNDNNGTSSTDPDDINYCASAPCVNNGTCKNIPESDRYECICLEPWGGLDCKEHDYCTNNECKNGADCINGPTNYTCECKKGWAGKLCHKTCPPSVCENGGTCTLGAHDEYKCICRPGFIGDKCEINVDECASNPCFNNATCVDKEDSFECHCKDGFMGERCHRPCQDIYQSCAFWEEQDRCESMRPSTKFFDINCASTCSQCVYQNDTINTATPLPPVLEPFQFLLGKWVINFSDPMRYPVDFNKSPYGYYEEIQFMVAPVTMFGTPSINYTARAVNNADPEDIQTNVGFVTLGPVFRPIKVALMSTGNDGMTLLEEGEMVGTSMKLQTEYLVLNPLLKTKAPKLLKREFSIQGLYLQESISRTSADGNSTSFTKYYLRESAAVSFL